ncbi:RNA polymerase sigma factor [Porticoccus sp. GXU_MW_L64]
MSDQKNYDSLYMSIRSGLLRIASRIVPPKDVEDIVQETYVRLCQVENKDDIRAPRSFLFRTARNLALDHLKRAESRLVVSIEDSGDLDFGEAQDLSDNTLDQVASDQEFSMFCEAVRYLPVQCRKAFVLKKVYGYSQREVARELGISESTVEKHIAQGIKRCTYFMMQHEERGAASRCRPGRQGRFSGGRS